MKNFKRKLGECFMGIGQYCDCLENYSKFDKPQKQSSENTSQLSFEKYAMNAKDYEFDVDQIEVDFDKDMEFAKALKHKKKKKEKLRTKEHRKDRTLQKENSAKLIITQNQAGKNKNAKTNEETPGQIQQIKFQGDPLKQRKQAINRKNIQNLNISTQKCDPEKKTVQFTNEETNIFEPPSDLENWQHQDFKDHAQIGSQQLIDSEEENQRTVKAGTILKKRKRAKMIRTEQDFKIIDLQNLDVTPQDLHNATLSMKKQRQMQRQRLRQLQIYRLRQIQRQRFSQHPHTYIDETTNMHFQPSFENVSPKGNHSTIQSYRHERAIYSRGNPALDRSLSPGSNERHVSYYQHAPNHTNNVKVHRPSHTEDQGGHSRFEDDFGLTAINKEQMNHKILDFDDQQQQQEQDDSVITVKNNDYFLDDEDRQQYQKKERFN